MKKNFCLVGVDQDFNDFLIENKKKYIGLFSKFKNKNYQHIKKKIGGENINDWKKIKKKFNPSVFIVIDDGKKREFLEKKIFKNNVKNLFLKSSFIEKTSQNLLAKKRGILVQKFVKISSNVKINNGVKINIGCQIHHNCNIGKYSTLAPRSVVLGNVKIGNYTFIGANSTIKQNVKIGNNCTIGAGSVVVKNVQDNQTVAGIPAKKLIKKNKK
jgi:sugar O-acyltransferase (sialic acid O-acetyltransferase NeuD family)